MNSNLPLNPSQLTSFFRFNLSPMDEMSGSILSSVQVAVMQNLRADIAEQKLNLLFTPNDVLSYTQQESFLKGQLDMIQYLLDRSQESEKLAVANAAATAASQNQ